MPDNDSHLDPAIEAALDKVLAASGGDNPELLARMRNLIVNCLADNYDQSDVRAVIELAMHANDEPEDDD
jgi:hypothetical protein